MQPDWTVATARWWHMPGITRLIRQSRRRRPSANVLASEALLWAPFWSPSVGLVQSVWGSRLPGVPTSSSHVVELAGTVIGLGQCRPRADGRQWEVMFLAIAPNGVDVAGVSSGFPDRRAQQLLGRLCDAAIERGAERIFAMVRDDGDGAAVLRQLSFSPVTRELTYVQPADSSLEGAGTPPPAPVVGLRRQERSDAFGVHQLYRATTPPVVQLAEARRPQSWEPPRGRFGALPRLARGGPGRRWVVVRDDRIVGWAHLTVARRGAHHLSLMVDPSDPGLAVSLVGVAAEVARRTRVAPVFASIRDHQWPEREALEGIGFRPYETNVLMMKQLALVVPSARRNLAPAMERVVS
jgi:hypothetical protein